MKITILNGNPCEANREFDDYLAGLSRALDLGGSQVTLLPLRQMDIRYCIGCFDCWLKTPGECVSRDESAEVCRAMINADWVLFAAPLVMGYPSALLKKTMDKMIPLIHPYMVLDKGEIHHRARYAHYPKIGLLLEREDDTDAEDLRLVSDLFARMARNIKSTLQFTRLVGEPVMEVANEINRL
jgi:multimeric flavodoxin WrbA